MLLNRKRSTIFKKKVWNVLKPIHIFEINEKKWIVSKVLSGRWCEIKHKFESESLECVWTYWDKTHWDKNTFIVIIED